MMRNSQKWIHCNAQPVVLHQSRHGVSREPRASQFLSSELARNAPLSFCGFHLRVLAMLCMVNVETIRMNSCILHHFSEKYIFLLEVLCWWMYPSLTTSTVSFWIFKLELYRSFISNWSKHCRLFLFSVITFSWTNSTLFLLNRDLKGVVQICFFRDGFGQIYIWEQVETEIQASWKQLLSQI